MLKPKRLKENKDKSFVLFSKTFMTLQNKKKIIFNRRYLENRSISVHIICYYANYLVL